MSARPSTPAGWLRAASEAALALLTRRPQLCAAGAGAALAWPVAGASRWVEPALVGLLTLAAAAVELRPAAPRSLRLLSGSGLIGLGAMAVAQRPTEPAVGLITAIGATLALLRLGGHGSGPVGLWRTVGLLAAVLFVPDALGGSRLAVLSGLCALALAAAPSDGRVIHGLSDLLDLLLESPARLLVSSFAVLATLGGFALALPPSAEQAPIRLIDALFTSVSATCVTGLAVLDTPNAFSSLGELLILLLIQLGGLGIMTFASAGAVYLGRRIGLRYEAMTADLVGGGSARTDLERALRTVFRVTFVTEALGALLLAIFFWLDGDPLPRALWHGVFTSISAFCNAGFALRSDSLMSYQDSPGVLGVVSLLIVLGGLGPLVVVALPALARGRGSLHTRVVAISTGALLVVPAGLFLAFEWGNTLAGMGLGERLINAWFQSVTLRTAGFNSIDFAAIRPATWTLSVVCMFIGGSPASTAGGAKTTTIAVLLLAVAATIRGRTEASAFGRAIPHRTVYEAAAVTTLGVLSAAGALTALQLTQTLPLDLALFEVVSALGTVGLSMGATGRVDDVGKIVLMACMFAGRVGPLTLFIFLMGRAGTGRRLPHEALQVG